MHESSYSYWSLSPNSGGKYSVFDVANNGKTNYDAAYIPLGVRPTVYLNSSVKITANDGSSATPYKLGL